MSRGDTAYAPWEVTEESEALMLEREKRLAAEGARKDARRTLIWTGIGWGLLTLAALVLILGGFYLALEAAQQHGRDSVDIERARAEQVRACTEITEPLERQYCLLALDVDADGSSSG